MDITCACDLGNVCKHMYTCIFTVAFLYLDDVYIFIGKGSLMGEFMPLNSQLDNRGGKLQVSHLSFTIRNTYSCLGSTN